MTDLADQLRPITAEEWPRFSATMSTTFGEAADGPYQQTPSPIAELDRSLALFDGDRVAATAGIYSLDMAVPGATVPTAGVTWITVAPTHRRQGVLTAIMRRQLTEVQAAEREPVAALWAAEAGIYGRFGYAPASWRGGWTGDAGRLRLRPDVDCGTGRVSLVDVGVFRPAAVRLYDQLRRHVPGNLARDDRWWDRVLLDRPETHRGGTARQHVLHTEADGTVTGYATYQVRGSWSDEGEPTGTLTVTEVRAAAPAAYAALWRFLLGIDLVRTVQAPSLSDDDPLRHLLADPRAWHARPVDALWVRLVDVGRALSARRYPARIDLVFEVRDRFCDWNDGRWHVWGHPAGAFCDRTDRDPDLVLDIEALSAAYLGGVSLASLQAAGRVTEVSPGAVVAASTAFRWPVAPWCPDTF
ncbi:Putative GCN5-related N-acetyltransferase [Modestobacter italicus]|uniref:GCN5-related N-acetyltransferase n=1 Tax=Modestobacter italicus (strain DSM 44449 / CECT 9708 / BC 501) TaxID=2732864 RepID=I4EUE2_MODI5|nr:GNAT family N-acetyltransferase [Modestobacter marinus]CCH87005.1 Putative GCN5-related N-acetyltransferase [Modestobacter marinus]